MSDFDRAEATAAFRLAARGLPARRRVRAWACVALAVAAALVALIGLSAWPLVLGIAVAAGLLASNRLWAWSLARRVVKDSPEATAHYRVDGDGLAVAQRGRTGSCAWSEVTRVIEG